MALSITSEYLAPLWSGTKRAFSHYANFALGVEQSEIFSRELQKAVRGTKNAETKKYVGGKGFKDFGGSFRSAWNSSKKAVENKSLWTVIKESFTKIPSEFKAAGKLVARTGKTSKYFGSTLKILGKRMPLIGNLIFAATEIPNIVNAFSKGGISTGVAETGKTAAKLGAFAAGAAIGQALIPIPFVGGLIGGAVGSFIADKICGKSFTEKQEEAEAAKAQTVQAAKKEAQPAKASQQAQAPVQQQAQQQEQTPAQQELTQDIYNKDSMNDSQREMLIQQAYSNAGINPFSMSSDFMDQQFMPQSFAFNQGYNSMMMQPSLFSQQNYQQNPSQTGFMNIASNPFMQAQAKQTKAVNYAA